MSALRRATYLLFVLTSLVTAQERLDALSACSTRSVNDCPGVGRYGKVCTWNGQNPPQSCNDFYNDVCSGYCGTAGRDAAASQCAGLDSYCWCNGWQDCPPPPDPCNCSLSADCCESAYCNGTWDESDSFCQYTPIVLNLQSNAAVAQLTSTVDGVSFDIGDLGRQLRISWTSGTSTAAFLTLDRNGNGLVDSGAELFGNVTPKRDGTRAANGFDALLDLDGGPEVSDGRIDSHDPVFQELRLWLDSNHNGYSERNELLTLEQAGVTTLFTDFSEGLRTDRFGNKYRFEGDVLIRMPNGEEVWRRVFDVLLRAGS
jgi:hypothetical protein